MISWRLPKEAPRSRQGIPPAFRERINQPAAFIGRLTKIHKTENNAPTRENSMVFYSYKGPDRPVRLSEETRRFAFDSLHHKYGLDTMRTPAVSMDDVQGFDSLSPLEKYDPAVSRIAKEAPIRICAGEKLSSTATLGNAISHVVPTDRRKKRSSGASAI